MKDCRTGLEDWEYASKYCCDEKPRRKKCKNCYKHYVNSYYRAKNIISIKPIICPVCGKRAKNINALKKHKSIYHRVKKESDSLEVVKGWNTNIQKVVESQVENEKKLTATPQSSIKRPGPSSTKKPGPASSKRPGPASSKRPGPAARAIKLNQF